MKSTTTTLLLSLSLAITSLVQAQQSTIAIVDKQRVINEFSQTEVFTKELTAKLETGRKTVTEMGDSLKAFEKKIKVQTDKVLDLDLNDTTRMIAQKERERLIKEYQGKLEKLLETRKSGSDSLTKERNEMEAKLLDQINKVVSEVANTKGADLVFDKSFLPKANKMILYQSSRVVDLTEEVIARLNKS